MEIAAHLGPAGYRGVAPVPAPALTGRPDYTTREGRHVFTTGIDNELATRAAWRAAHPAAAAEADRRHAHRAQVAEAERIVNAYARRRAGLA